MGTIYKNEIPFIGLSKQNVVDIIYPIGAIYISVNSAEPSTLFGGEWESVGSGRVLQGADDTHSAGSTIEAGLPNITGEFSLIWHDDQIPYKKDDNAFSTSSNGNKTTRMYSDSGSRYSDTISFDASKSNAIFGKSDTVQQSALVVNMWKRIG